jgi:hypothetical protein
MLRLFTRLLIIALGLIALGGTVGFAQSGQISGHVTDQQGAAIPDAAVQIVNPDRNFKRDTTTNGQGTYSATYLPAGRYEVNFRKEGFSSGNRVVQLEPGQALVLDMQLTVASTQSEVTVQAETTNQIELGTASLSTTLSNDEVAAYGLNGRNFSQLITMAPGVSNQTNQDEAKVGVAGSAKFSVNGGRVEYNTFEVDGSDVLNTSINTSRGQGEPLMVYPSIDAIQEMKVLTGDYSALYGKSASGSVLVTTKSGGPQFHGNLYGFIRNEMFNARNYFDPIFQKPNGLPDKRTPLYRRQDYGGTFGGPLYIPGVYNTKKDKTFFFWSEELRLEKTPVDYNQAVPTAAERNGDFSDVCPLAIPGGSTNNNLDITQYPDCPRAPAAGGSSGTPYVPQRQVNVGYISQAILNTGIIPAPNSTFGCDTTNPTTEPRCYNAAVSPPTYWREELFRIDHVLTPNEQLDFRYIHDAWDTTTLAPQWGVVQNSFPTVENRLFGPGLDLVVSLASVLPHGVLNRLTLSYAVEHITLTPQPGPGLTSLSRPTVLDNPSSALGNAVGNTTCGIATGPTPQFGTAQTVTECPMGYIFANGYGGNKMPGLVFQGTNGAYGGRGFAADTGYAPWNQANPTYSIRDDLSKTWGRHTIQAGFEATYAQQNELSAVSGANSGDLQGLLTYSNQQSKYTSGNAFADFLAGPGLESAAQINSGEAAPYAITAIKSYTQDSGQAKYYNRYESADIYLQDDFRVNSRLTLNLGFRASLFGTWFNPKDTAYNWLPEAWNKSIGGSIYVDGNSGYLVNKGTGSPVPLNLSSLDPSITNGLVQCGKNGVPDSCMSSSVFHPGPRFGFSWDPFGNGKTAVRGGYGLFWEHGTGYEANVGSLIGSAPLVLSETQSNPAGYNTIGFSCQEGTTQCGSSVLSTGIPSFPLNVTSIPTKAIYPYTQQWSLSVQHEIQKNLIAQLAYVGTKGTHLTAVRDLNQLQPASSNPFLPGQPITAGVCAGGSLYDYFPTTGINAIPPTGPPITSSPGIGLTSPGWNNMVVACTGNPGFATGGGQLLGISADAVRPYPGFSNIISVENIANSSYHALQGTLREVTGPLTIGLAYTYSHSIDDSSDRSSANFTNSLDIRTNRGSSDFDQRHMLNVNYVYTLPLIRWIDGFADLLGSDDSDSGSPTASHPDSGRRLRKTLFDNWQLAGITTWQTGTPFSVINGGSGDGTGASDNAGVGDGLGVGSYPDVIESSHSIKPYVSSSSNGSNIGPLLGNPGAFVAPQGLTFGNAGRNFMRNPSRINFNVSLLKHFKPFHEKSDVEFRAEAFNVFNHTQFRIYDPSHPGNTGNNVINCYGDITTQYSAGASSCLAGNSFLHPVDAHDPRILQFALKWGF